MTDNASLRAELDARLDNYEISEEAYHAQIYLLNSSSERPSDVITSEDELARLIVEDQGNRQISST